MCTDVCMKILEKQHTDKMLVAIRIQLIFISFFVLFCILQMYYVYICIFQYRWIKTVKYKKKWQDSDWQFFCTRQRLGMEYILSSNSTVSSYMTLQDIALSYSPIVILRRYIVREVLCVPSGPSVWNFASTVGCMATDGLLRISIPCLTCSPSLQSPYYWFGCPFSRADKTCNYPNEQESN